MLGTAHYVRVSLFLLAGTAPLLCQTQAGENPADWPRTDTGYVLPEMTARQPARQTGIHRKVPFDALQSGTWVKLSNGDPLWQLRVQSRGAKALRAHISSFRPDAGALYVRGENGFQAVTERGDSWSGVVAGDTLWLHYRPFDPSGTDLPFTLDAVSHALEVENAAGAGPYLQVERDDAARRCDGWLLAAPSGGPVTYFLTSHSCIPDAPVTATAVLWHGGEAHSVTPVLVATRHSGNLDFSLLRLDNAPATLPREEGTRPEIAAALPHLASFLESPSTATPERSADTGRAACALQPLAFGTTVNASLNAADCFSPDGKYYADVYTFTGSANQRVSITMTSGEVDSYLTLYHPSGAVVARNDDGGGGLHARIDAVLTTGGVYRVEASTFHEYSTGSYVLRLDTSGLAAPGLLPQRFVAVTPCRVMDTRAGEGKTGVFGPPFLRAGTSRDLAMTESGCGIPATATAFSLNITVVPQRALSYLTVYPAGQVRPLASTLNSFEGRVVSNAALIPAGSNGRISIFVTDDSDVIVDINGFFTP